MVFLNQNAELAAWRWLGSGGSDPSAILSRKVSGAPRSSRKLLPTLALGKIPCMSTWAALDCSWKRRLRMEFLTERRISASRGSQGDGAGMGNSVNTVGWRWEKGKGISAHMRSNGSQD